jgi:hypothetical protein
MPVPVSSFVAATGSGRTNATEPTPGSETRFANSITQTASVSDDWTDLPRLGGDDGSVSTCDLTASGLSETISLEDFGFSIPNGSTIDGVTVEINRQRVDGGGLCRDLSVILKKAGAAGSNKAVATAWPSVLTARTYGGATDLWGLILTPEEVNDSNFGLTFRVMDGDVSDVAEVDYISISVYYTA